MATKRAFVSDLELQDTLSKLQKTNEDSVVLIGQLGTQVDGLVKEVIEFQQSLVDPITPIVDPVQPPVEPIVPIDVVPLKPVDPVVEPVVPIPQPTEETVSPVIIIEPVLPAPLVPGPEVAIDPTLVEVVTPVSGTPPPEIQFSAKSNLVIASWNHDSKTGFTHWSHKLMWEGKKYKSCSIYYCKGNANEWSNWNNIESWEYMDFDYGDSELLSHSLSFLCRSRSNDLYGQYGFTTKETLNGGEGYWDVDFNHNDNDTFYKINHIRSIDPNPHNSGAHDHLKIILENVHQSGNTVQKDVKIAQGLYKIGRAIATHVVAATEPKQLLQYQVFRKEDNGIRIDMISKPESLDIEDFKIKIADYMSKPLISV
jgi:hypothetical protein